MQPVRVAAALVVNEGGVLIARRRRGERLGGYWEFPGGKIEPGESEEEAVLREIGEELGLEIVVGTHFMTSKDDQSMRPIELSVYWAQSETRDLQLHVHDAAAWVSADDLHKYRFAPADIPVVGRLSRIDATDYGKT